MTSLHLVIYSYVFVILLCYLFIYSFLITFFFHSGRVPEGIILPHISRVSSNQPLPCIHLDKVRYPAQS